MRRTLLIGWILIMDAAVCLSQASGYVAYAQSGGAPQVYADQPSVYYPTRLYDAYAAYEGETVDGGYDRGRLRVQTARKTATFFTVSTATASTG